MNKYLLLRDNKQSGPYTVPELIEHGIKPYDLVWLEGKSAAWRYPSEVEELKAFSPAIEEQPFDRFYKRPEPVAQQPEHSPYLPKDESPVVEEVEASPEFPAKKKVYINFPVNAPLPQKPAPAREPVVVKSATPDPVKEQLNPPGFAEKTFFRQAEEVYASRHITSKQPTTNRKFMYGAIAASIVLVAFIAVLLINNKSQQDKLNQLNTIVKQIEENKAAQATEVKNEESAPVAPSETIINPELLNLATQEDHATPEQKQETASLTLDPTPVKQQERKPINADGAVFTERPVTRRTDKTTADVPATTDQPAAASAPSSENVYKLVSVSANNYKTGVLGGISNLQLQLTNNSSRELQKVEVRINYLGPEKKVVNTQTVYFDNVSPGAQTTIDVPKSKRGVTINYTITDIKS